MCDHSGIEEDLERYRRNNVDLAVALNDLKSELNIVQMQLLDRNRELQQVFDENAALKNTLAQKDSQISTWRALIMDLVTSNAKKCTEVMQKMGLVPATNGATKPIENSVLKTENMVTTALATLATSTTPPTKSAEQNGRADVLKRQRDYEVAPSGLADLTEESIHSQFNESKSSNASPEKNVSHVTSRRRASVPTSSPPKPLRESQKLLIASGETKGKKSSAKVHKLERIIDENSPVNGTNARPSRKTAPKNLSEPKLSTKLRRN